MKKLESHHTRVTNIRSATRKHIHRLLLLLFLLLGSVGAKAADYVLAYVNGNTTYYLARNGTTGVQRVTAFDPTTCIWSCENAAGTASQLNNSTTYGWLYQSVNNTKYYLSASSDNFSLVENPSKTTGNNSQNYTCWRTNGTYVYNYYQYRQGLTNRSYSYYINLNNTPARNTNANTASNARPYAITSSTVNATTTITVPAITPATAELDINDAQTFTASATATTTPAYTTYTFNNTTHYYFEGDYTSEADMKASAAWATAAAAPTVTYAWTLTGAANSNLSPTSGTGSSITITHSTQASADVSSTLSVTASVTANGVSASESSTSNATVTALAPKTDPTSISITSANPMTVYAGNTGNITYSLTPYPCYNNVTYTSNNTGIATVSNSGVVTGVAAGQTTITVSAKKIDGTTSSALTTTITVNVREKVATPVISFTPTAADNGATATAEITCSTPGTTIYYTINGGEPTTSSTPYNGTFSVNDGESHCL